VDAGAHIGYFSLLASKLVGPFGRVYALEPEEKTYCALCANLELNAVRNVLALPVAAGARDGRELLYPAPIGNSGSAALRRRWGTFDPENEASKPWAVSVSSISSILDPAELSRLRLVKIDVEGYELEVLHGLAGVFDAGYRPALVVEVHGDAASAVGAWAAESRRTHGLFTYRLVAGCSSDRSVPDTAPVEPIHETELRSLESKFFELLLSPLPLIDDGASAAQRSAVLGAG
jgi:FkbM family methyltransferase